MESFLLLSRQPVFSVIWHVLFVIEQQVHTHTHTVSFSPPLSQRATYLALHGSLFGPDGTVNYDYIVTKSVNCC